MIISSVTLSKAILQKAIPVITLDDNCLGRTKKHNFPETRLCVIFSSIRNHLKRIPFSKDGKYLINEETERKKLFTTPT